MSLRKDGYLVHQTTQLDITALEKEHDLINRTIGASDQRGQIPWEHCAKHGPAAPPIQIARYRVPETGITHEITKHSEARLDITVEGWIHHTMCQLLTTEMGNVLAEYFKESTIPLKYISGILPSTGADDSGIWHRDTYELFTTVHSTQLPPWYLVCLLYLNEESDAPTQLIPASHQDPRTVEEIVTTTLAPLEIRPKSGQLLILDGRTVHRGGPGHRLLGARKILYTTIHPGWYTEPLDMIPHWIPETFASNCE